jgi:hypothetical protein
MTPFSSEDRQPPGEWCWCPDLPEGQDPHDCSEHAGRRLHQYDGAHIHPAPDPAVPIPAAARDQIVRAIETSAGLDPDDPDEAAMLADGSLGLDDAQQYARQAADIVRSWPVTVHGQYLAGLVRMDVRKHRTKVARFAPHPGQDPAQALAWLRGLRASVTRAEEAYRELGGSPERITPAMRGGDPQ